MSKTHSRPDVVRIQESTNSVCCFHQQIYIEYEDEPVWSRLICPFCGNHSISNLTVPDNVRAEFCRKRDFDAGKQDLEMFDKELQGRIGLFNWCRLSNVR